MNLSRLIDNSVKLLKAHGPEILTALGIGGVAATAYFASKASIEATRLVDASDSAGEWNELSDIDRKKQIVKHTWRLYVPAAVSGVGTIACITFASKGHSKRTAAALTAYSVTEKAYSEYRERITEEIGKRKDQKALDDIAQDRVKANPPSSSEVVVLGKGEVLCCELYTHRYFRSDMESLRKAENDINYWMLRHRYVTLDDFYNLIGLSPTDVSGKLGWDDDEIMHLEFSTVLSEDNEPCLAFRYSYVKPI